MIINNFYIDRVSKSSKKNNIFTVTISGNKEYNEDNESKEYIAKIIKIFSDKSYRTTLNNFVPELIINCNLNNENCLSPVAVKYEKNTISLVYEKADCTLFDYNSYNIDKITDIFNQLINGVEYLHSLRILHGDIKPSNVLVFGNNVKISDYGESTFLLEGNKGNFTKKMYTKQYRAPEVWNSDEWGFAADIWALGCTFFYILYGREFFPEQNNDEQYKSCLESFKELKRNDYGNSFELPEEWGNSDYLFFNSLIIKMCNPDQTKRPSIFELRRQMPRNSTSSLWSPLSSLSCSPEFSFLGSSSCSPRFEDIDEFNKRRYLISNFIAPCSKEILSLLGSKSEEYISVFLIIYSNICSTGIFDSNIYKVTELLTNCLLRKKCNSVSQSNIEKLKDILSSNKIVFFDTFSYYGIG